MKQSKDQLVYLTKQKQQNLNKMDHSIEETLLNRKLQILENGTRFSQPYQSLFMCHCHLLQVKK